MPAGTGNSGWRRGPLAAQASADGQHHSEHPTRPADQLLAPLAAQCAAQDIVLAQQRVDRGECGFVCGRSHRSTVPRIAGAGITRSE